MNQLDLTTLKSNSENAARFLKAFANEQRLMIMCHLREGENSVTELQQQLDLSQSALSQHLARLRKDGLVATRREAQTIYYSLPSGLAEELIYLIHQHYCNK